MAEHSPDRIVAAEQLDELEVTDEAAVHSRGDLRRLNAIMRHGSLMAVEPLVEMLRRKQPRLADIGCGDGTFLLNLARQLSGRVGKDHAAEAVLVDRHPPDPTTISQLYESVGWKIEAARADVFDWLSGADRVDVIVANLFLHHFQTDALARLLALAAGKCDLFIACEPRRSAVSRLGSRLLWLIGCHAVTRHDAVVSVRAGFAGREISALWRETGWSLREAPAGIFSHRFVAERK